MSFGIANVAAITMLCYLAGMAWKNADPLDDKWIPTICGTTGLLLGILAYVLEIPDMPAQDVITAAAIGVSSGLAATGLHQLGKQLKEK